MPLVDNFKGGLYGKGNVFIQYKGTEICADFTCPNCKEQEHIDGDFCYSWKCPNCNKVYNLSSYIELFEVKHLKEV